MSCHGLAKRLRLIRTRTVCGQCEKTDARVDAFVCVNGSLANGPCKPVPDVESNGERKAAPSHCVRHTTAWVCICVVVYPTNINQILSLCCVYTVHHAHVKCAAAVLCCLCAVVHPLPLRTLPLDYVCMRVSFYNVRFNFMPHSIW